MTTFIFFVLALVAAAVGLAVGLWTLIAPFGSIPGGGLLVVCGGLLVFGAVRMLREELDRARSVPVPVTTAKDRAHATPQARGAHRRSGRTGQPATI